MTLSVYLSVECHSKAINCFIQRRKYDNIISYASTVDLKMEYSSMLSQLLFSNLWSALDLATFLVNAESGPLIESKLSKAQLV